MHSFENLYFWEDYGEHFNRIHNHFHIGPHPKHKLPLKLRHTHPSISPPNLNRMIFQRTSKTFFMGKWGAAPEQNLVTIEKSVTHRFSPVSKELSGWDSSMRNRSMRIWSSSLTSRPSAGGKWDKRMRDDSDEEPNWHSQYYENTMKITVCDKPEIWRWHITECSAC